MYLASILGLFIVYLAGINCLHEDQVGKFDWRKQFIGIPKFVYHHPTTEYLIVGTESSVIASLHIKDGSIIWRQLLPKSCSRYFMTVMKSSDNNDYLITTSCGSAGHNQSVWDPQNGLLASDSRIKDLSEDQEASKPFGDPIREGVLEAGSKLLFKTTPNSKLEVYKDGRVSLCISDSVVWSREESLASVTDVEIVKLPSSMRDRFGLRKTIVLVTSRGKLFGMDTYTGQTNWEVFDEQLSTLDDAPHATLMLTKQSDEDAEESRAILIHPVGLIILLNPITGAILEKRRLSKSIKQLAQTEVDNENGERGVIILDVANEVHIYPDSFIEKVRNNIDKYYLTLVEKSPPSLDGYKFVITSNSIVTKQVWSFPMKTEEKIVNLGIKRIDEEVHSPARVLGDRGILYKYLNPNLIAVMTEGSTGDSCSPDHHINVYLVDGVTGALVHSIYHPKSKGPFNLVHSENWLVYSFYNTKARRTEISSLEMFEGTTQTNSSVFSSLTRSSTKPKLIEHKSFIFPSGIDAMVDTVTLRGMTNRHIIVALPTGALLEIPKIYLDPRRPINMLMEHREEGLIPYMPELPIPSESVINYDQTLLAVRKIVTSPAILESTSLVFAYGLDLFFTRVTPSKTFDILKDDFDHLLITAVLIFLVVASYVSKLLAQRKALHAAWK